MLHENFILKHAWTQHREATEAGNTVLARVYPWGYLEGGILFWFVIEERSSEAALSESEHCKQKQPYRRPLV